jgi:SNF2 family DNA or RNA helicase
MFIINCVKDGRKDKFILKFQYEPNLISKIKEIHYEDREYLPKEKLWKLKTYSLYLLMKEYKGRNDIFFKFQNDKEKNYFQKKVKKKINEIKDYDRRKKELEEKKEYWLNYKEQLKETYKVHEDKLHQKLKDGVKLYPYQSQAVLFADAIRNVLFALDMGTGKSVISISFSEFNNFNKVFVITPKSLKFNYYDEINKFTYSKAHVINWKKNEYSIEEAKYIIINYDFFRSKNSIEKFEKLGIDNIECLILDECHRIKNEKSQTYNNIKDIFDDKIFLNETPCKVFMSGTPMNNRAYELYTVMNMLSPLDFPNKTTFYQDYCGMTYNPDSFDKWDYDPKQTNFESLYEKISPYIFRKRKEEVLKFLPGKTYDRILFELNSKERKQYNDILNEVKEDLDGKLVKINPMTAMLKVRQYLSNLKVRNKDLHEFIDLMIESGEKIVIMDYFVEGLEYLHDKYKDISVLHYGNTSPEDRREMVKLFQDKESNVKIFFSTVQTGKEGLTLTAASKIVVLTEPYTVGENDQIVDRLDRISQTKKVNVYYPLYLETVDIKVFYLVEEKKKEIRLVLDNEKYETKMNDSVINELISDLKK